MVDLEDAQGNKRAQARGMRLDRAWLLGLLAALALALPSQPAAASVPLPPAQALQCPADMLCRTVIDRAAWDEPVTLTLRPAREELVPVVLVPARTQMRTVTVRPPDLIHHKVEVSPERTLRHPYLIEAAHYETQRQWISSGHWQDYYLDTSGYLYRPGYYRTIPGEWRTTAGSSHWHPGYSVYVPGRSWQEPGHWATRPGRNVRTCYWWGWCFERYVPGSDYWVPGKTVYVPGYSYSVPGSSHWHDGYTYYVPPRSEWVPESREYVRSGHWASRYVDTSHYVTRRVFVPDLWGTRTERIPAVYNEWDELVPAVTRLEPYTVPAVMGTRVVHHPAVTRTEIRHHDAVTREIATDPASLSTQSRQSAASRNVPGTTTTVTGVRTPVHIPLVAGAGSTGAWLVSSARDTWWADRTAGGWSTGGTATHPSYDQAASSSSISSRAVSDAPLRGNAFLTSGGRGLSSGGADLAGDLLLLTGLATAAAAGHQLARGSASGAAASTGSAPAGWTHSGVTPLQSTAVRGAPARGADLVRPSGASGSLYASAGSRSLRHETAAIDGGPPSDGGGLFAAIGAAWDQGTGWLRDRASETVSQAGPALERAKYEALLGIYHANNAALDRVNQAATPLGEGLGALMTVGAESTYDVNGVTVVNNAGGVGRAVAWTTGFVGEVLGGADLERASRVAEQNTITLGSKIIVSNTTVPKGSPLLAHELGHIEQAEYLGVAYIPLYLLTLTGSHDTHPAEVNANRQAGLRPDGSPPDDWKYSWPHGDAVRARPPRGPDLVPAGSRASPNAATPATLPERDAADRALPEYAFDR